MPVRERKSINDKTIKGVKMTEQLDSLDFLLSFSVIPKAEGWDFRESMESFENIRNFVYIFFII